MLSNFPGEIEGRYIEKCQQEAADDELEVPQWQQVPASLVSNCKALDQRFSCNAASNTSTTKLT